MIKAFIKQLIPPIVFIVRDYFTKTWDLEFISDDKVPIKGSYNSPDEVAQQEREYKRQINRSGFDYSSLGDLNEHNKFLTFQFIISYLSCGFSDFRILDYGGALGFYYHLAKEATRERERD